MSERATVAKPAGYTTETMLDGSILEHDTLQCVHCGMHWQFKPGSGKIRGHCFRCNGPICGPKCQVCYPWEQKLEDAAAGRIP